MAQPDIVVVGAGLAGLATAWHLAPHARVLVVDQAQQPGAEASSQNAGMVRRLGDDPFERALAVRTAAWMADPGPDWPAPPPSRITGAVLGLGLDPHHLNDAVAHLRARSIVVEALCAPAEVAEVAVALRGAPLVGAWWLPDERVADAWTLLQGFGAGLKRHGGELRCRTRILGLQRTADRIVGIDTDRGSIQADRIVLATGAWSAALARAHGLHRPLIPLRRTLLQSTPHPCSHPDHPWVWIDDVGLYARPEAGGGLVSGCDEAVDPPDPGPGSRGGLEPGPRALAASKLDRWLPALADAELRSGWTGLRTFAPDRRPVLGEDPDLRGLWWVAGLGGFGVTCSYAAGEAVATWMMGDQTPWLSPRAVSPGRSFLRRWPIRPHGDLATSELIDAPEQPQDLERGGGR